MNNPEGKTLRGFNWNLATQVVSQFFNFFIGIILARLLSPKEFGLVAMVTVMFGFADVIKEFGIGAFIIQKPDINERELSLAFWLSLLGGVTTGGFFVLVASSLAAFYDKPIIQLLTVVLSLNFLFTSLAVVPGALLLKTLDFKALFKAMIYTEFLSSLIAVSLAVNGFGVWSLAARIVVKAFINTILMWRFSSWRPSFYFNKRVLSSINKFSLPLIGTHSMNYWVRNLDDLLVGKLFGDKILGEYSRAYSFLTIALGQLGQITSKFAFPIFSKLQKDKSKLGVYFLKLNRLTAVVFFPFMIILFFTAKEVVIILLGRQWQGVIPLLEIFAITGIFQVVVAPIGIVFLSLGQTRLQFRLGILTSSVGIISIVLGLGWGVLGVASGLLVATLINIFPNIYFSGRLIHVSFWSWVNNLKEVFFCNLFLGLVLFLFSKTFHGASELRVFIGNFSIGIFIYLLMVFLFRVKAFLELMSLIKILIRNLR